MRPIKSLLKIVIGYFFGLVGLQVRRGGMRGNMKESLANIRRIGFRPATVIDVGVAYGTDDLYSQFPEAEYLLVEPLEEWRGTMEKILKKLRGHYVIAAASDKEGVATLNVHAVISSSSVFRETDGAKVDGTPREIKTTTLDKLVAEKNLQPPFLIKVDTQGAELLVLKGAEKTLKQTELVVMEVSLFEFLIGSPQAHEVIAFMKDRGFLPYDIYGGMMRPIDGALAQVDIVFAREGGVLRKHHNYATPEQRKAELANRKPA